MSTDEPTVEGLDHLQRIAATALSDDAYRQRLMSDPETVLSEEGLTVPDGVRVTVHQNTTDHIHLVLPIDIGAAQQLLADEVDLLKLIEGFLF